MVNGKIVVKSRRSRVIKVRTRPSPARPTPSNGGGGIVLREDQKEFKGKVVEAPGGRKLGLGTRSVPKSESAIERVISKSPGGGRVVTKSVGLRTPILQPAPTPDSFVGPRRPTKAVPERLERVSPKTRVKVGLDVKAVEKLNLERRGGAGMTLARLREQTFVGPRRPPEPKLASEKVIRSTRTKLERLKGPEFTPLKFIQVSPGLDIRRAAQIGIFVGGVSLAAGARIAVDPFQKKVESPFAPIVGIGLTQRQKLEVRAGRLGAQIEPGISIAGIGTGAIGTRPGMGTITGRVTRTPRTKPASVKTTPLEPTKISRLTERGELRGGFQPLGKELGLVTKEIQTQLTRPRLRAQELFTVAQLEKTPGLFTKKLTRLVEPEVTKPIVTVDVTKLPIAKFGGLRGKVPRRITKIDTGEVLKVSPRRTTKLEDISTRQTKLFETIKVTTEKKGIKRLKTLDVFFPGKKAQARLTPIRLGVFKRGKGFLEIQPFKTSFKPFKPKVGVRPKMRTGVRIPQLGLAATKINIKSGVLGAQVLRQKQFLGGAQQLRLGQVQKQKLLNIQVPKMKGIQVQALSQAAAQRQVQISELGFPRPTFPRPTKPSFPRTGRRPGLKKKKPKGVPPFLPRIENGDVFRRAVGKKGFSGVREFKIPVF